MVSVVAFFSFVWLYYSLESTLTGCDLRDSSQKRLPELLLHQILRLFVCFRLPFLRIRQFRLTVGNSRHLRSIQLVWHYWNSTFTVVCWEKSILLFLRLSSHCFLQGRHVYFLFLLYGRFAASLRRWFVDVWKRSVLWRPWSDHPWRRKSVIVLLDYWFQFSLHLLFGFLIRFSVA